jgi:type IV pilus assembly protein PilA
MKEKRNQGFTLVELIIVIAIIAILTVVAIPQYVKYVEKSEIATDKEIASSVESALHVLCADGTITVAAAPYVIWDTDVGLVDGTNKPIVEAITGEIPKAASDKFKAEGEIKFMVAFDAEGDPIVSTDKAYRDW